MDLDKRDLLIKLLKDKFLPMDYGNWQGDELFEQIIAVIRNPEHSVGDEFSEAR